MRAALPFCLALFFSASVWAQDHSHGEEQTNQTGSEESGTNDELAREEFGQGAAAYQAANYAQALTHFERAYELSGRPALHYNIALVHDRLRHDEVALERYELFLQLVEDSEYRPHARERANAIRRVLEERERGDKRAREAAVQSALAKKEAADDRTRRLWIGIGVAGALIVGGAVTAVVLSRGGDPQFAEGDFGPPTAALVEF